MPRTPADTAVSTPDKVTPGILLSKDLARILTPLLAEMLARHRTDAEAEHMGRYLAEPLNAIESMITEIRAYHGLPALLDSLLTDRTAREIESEEAAS